MFRTICALLSFLIPACIATPVLACFPVKNIPLTEKRATLNASDSREINCPSALPADTVRRYHPHPFVPPNHHPKYLLVKNDLTKRFFFLTLYSFLCSSLALVLTLYGVVLAVLPYIAGIVLLGASHKALKRARRAGQGRKFLCFAGWFLAFISINMLYYIIFIALIELDFGGALV